MPKRKFVPARYPYLRRSFTRSRYVGSRSYILGKLGRRAALAGSRMYPYATAAYLGYRGIKAIRARRARANRFSTRNIGEYVGTQTSKLREIANTGFVNRSTRTLYSFPLAEIPKGQNRSERERLMVNLRGFKICMEVANFVDGPFYFNVAVISPKAAGDIASIPNQDFFRNDDNTDNRGTNFSTNLTSNELHCLSINTDLYTVLRHKRFRMIPGLDPDPANNSQTGLSYTNINWYVKLKRQLRYEGTATKPIDGDCFLVYWADVFGNDAGAPVGENAFATSQRFITYFREPKP